MTCHVCGESRTQCQHRKGYSMHIGLTKSIPNRLTQSKLREEQALCMISLLSFGFLGLLTILGTRLARADVFVKAMRSKRV